MSAYTWGTQGACVGTPTPDLWHPNGNGVQAQRETQEASRICMMCPIQIECLQYAIDNRVTGVWGGVRIPEGNISGEDRAYKPRMYLDSL